MKENSIEEDIKIVENYLANSAINEIESNFFKNGGWETIDLEIPKSMQHILSDYKRVLKENEQLKNDIENMYDEEVVITIIEDNFNLCRNEVLEVLGSEEQMNEEEKKAIKILNTFEFRGKTINYKEISSEDSKSVKIVLNLLEKLQKENEELKEKENKIYKEVQESLAFEKFLIVKERKPDLFNQGRFYISQIIYDILNDVQNPAGIHKENKCIQYIDYIPIQKVKDKIEEEKLPLTIVGGRKNKKTLEYGIKLGRRQALQELIEERKEK